MAADRGDTAGAGVGRVTRQGGTRGGGEVSEALFEVSVRQPAPVKWTERMVLDRLVARYGRRYPNGAQQTLRYVGAAHVRFGPLWPRAIADFLALDTWGNYGPEATRHPLLGFEVKVSRSDYLSEIKNLDKSLPFREVCREWYMVVSDRGIVRDDLPEGWGLLVANSRGLLCVRKSALNPSPKPIPRGLLAGFMRAVATQASEQREAAVVAAREDVR